MKSPQWADGADMSPPACATYHDPSYISEIRVIRGSPQTKVTAENFVGQRPKTRYKREPHSDKSSV
ncbi:MAG: hypothetical protein DLM52_02040 [Chthoniobacterales bacterium]|nr:MAG: hypothetical protein DLM52_02040 [Chthoniobacterales bacterium]